MSFDFAVFDPKFAPRDGAAFREWYTEQTDWDIDQPEPQPSLLTPPLLDWYRAMTAQFPDMNRSADVAEVAIDYSFTKAFMYCSMATNQANEAWRLAQEKASEFSLGTYDPMSDDERSNRCIVFPDGPLADPPSFFSKLFGKAKD